MKLENIHWLGHDTFRLDGPSTVYVDPWKLKDDPVPADLILVSHDHFDHFSPSDIERIVRENTAIFTTESVAEALTGDVRVLSPGQVEEAHGVRVEAVAAYNTDKEFHPKAQQHLGFIIEIEGFRIYHAGDTDLIPEMEGLEPDVALLPVSGTYVMAPEEAAQAAERIRPGVAIPMHYGDIVGSLEDAERFAAFYTGRTVILPKK